jgi:ribosome-associated protein
MQLDLDALAKEFSFRTSRSGGSGGQNVNKVSTKVELLWDFYASPIFSDHQKNKISTFLTNRINKENIFQITSEEARTQLRNKYIVIKKTIALIRESLIEEKERKPSRPTYSSVMKRLNNKRIQSLKKINRSRFSGE